MSKFKFFKNLGKFILNYNYLLKIYDRDIIIYDEREDKTDFKYPRSRAVS
jgi:hypothetical protein